LAELPRAKKTKDAFPDTRLEPAPFYVEEGANGPYEISAMPLYTISKTDWKE
jgi:hypothetical protein